MNKKGSADMLKSFNGLDFVEDTNFVELMSVMCPVFLDLSINGRNDMYGQLT
jgi:hypothetical protein